MNDKSDMTATDVINRYLTSFGLEKTKKMMLYEGMDDGLRNKLELDIDRIFQEGINP